MGIPENNLPIPNAAEWELKAQRADTTSLLTLGHIEPSPRAAKLVPQLLLPKYGWPHQQAGDKYPETEKSFRCTTNAISYTDRGFKLYVNRVDSRVEFVWDSKHCDVAKHAEWYKSVVENVGDGPLSIVPYWGFQDLFTKLGVKLINCFYVRAETKRENGKEYFHYNDVKMLKSINIDKMIDSIEEGDVYIDFDARTGHNHGTKFRIAFKNIPKLYSEVIPIIEPHGVIKPV